MTPFLRLLRKVSTEKKGRVFWLVEPGDPDPSHVVLGWQPHGVAWAGAELASPAWESSFLVGAFEPPPEWSPPGGAGRLRTGLGALAPGTWKVLEQCRSGTTLVALGREGVVLEKGGVYEVHTLRAGKDAAVAYDPKPLRTRGLARAPAPAWTTPFGLPATWTVPQARHLVALAVCSPAVWRRHREPGDPPAHHARALFMDPELWACPPES
jgi:hypothetical protein